MTASLPPGLRQSMAFSHRFPARHPAHRLPQWIALQAALRRMLLFAQCFRGHGALDHTDKLQRSQSACLRVSRSIAAAISGVALSPYSKQNAADLLAAPAVYHIIRGQLLLPVHAHIRRRILHIGKNRARHGPAAERKRRGRNRMPSAPASPCPSSTPCRYRGSRLTGVTRCHTSLRRSFAFSSKPSSLSATDQTAGIMQTLRNVSE